MAKIIKFEKKAILFTLACFILAIPILTLSILVYSLSIQAESRTTELGKLTRLNQLDYSIQHGFKKFFELQSGISVSTDTTTYLTITEDLTSPSRNIGGVSGAFNPTTGEITNYINFLETKYFGQIETRDYVLQRMNNELPITIMPFDSIYKHEPANNQIVFNPEKIVDIFNCTGGVGETYPNCRVAGSESLWPISYEIDITASETNGAIEPGSPCASTDNCINVRINLNDNSGASSYTYAVFPSLTSSKYIDFQGKDNAIKITTSSPARLVLKELNTNTNIQQITLKVRYAEFQENKELMKITLPENLYLISLEDIGVVKAGTARLD